MPAHTSSVKGFVHTPSLYVGALLRAAPSNQGWCHPAERNQLASGAKPSLVAYGEAKLLEVRNCRGGVCSAAPCDSGNGSERGRSNEQGTTQPRIFTPINQPFVTRGKVTHEQPWLTRKSPGGSFQPSSQHPLIPWDTHDPKAHVYMRIPHSRWNPAPERAWNSNMC